MNVLMIGDIVGPNAVAYLVERLPGLRRDFDVDLVIANAENCAINAPTPWTGFGMRVELVECLLDGGVDVITSGNHGWDGPEAEAVHRHPRVLRPHNLPAEVMGKGIVTLEVKGEPRRGVASDRGRKNPARSARKLAGERNREPAGGVRLRADKVLYSSAPRVPNLWGRL